MYIRRAEQFIFKNVFLKMYKPFIIKVIYIKLWNAVNLNKI